MRRLLAVWVVILSAVALQAAKIKLDVTVVGSQTTQGSGMYSVPGYATTDCGFSNYGTNGSVNCRSSSVPPQTFTYPLHGATLSLLLPDRRIVVVTCESKLNWTEWSMQAYRSCRVPTSANVAAEFDGDKAKLAWSVSIDGSKKASETYKIVALLAKMPQ